MAGRSFHYSLAMSNTSKEQIERAACYAVYLFTFVIFPAAAGYCVTTLFLLFADNTKY